MRKRKEIMEELKLIRNVYDKTIVVRNQIVLAEILLDIRDELAMLRRPDYQIGILKPSKREKERMRNEILKEDKS